jgi:hypothetical protein
MINKKAIRFEHTVAEDWTMLSTGDAGIVIFKWTCFLTIKLTKFPPGSKTANISLLSLCGENILAV